MLEIRLLLKLFKYSSNLMIIVILLIIFASTKVIATDSKKSNLLPLMSNLKSSNGVFVGREEFLSSMYNFLFNEEKPHTLIISGSPGAGKTQIINRYAELHKHNYEIIWWFDVNKNLNEQYREFARKWNKLVNKYYKDTAEQVFLQISLDSNNAYNIQEEVHDRLRTTKLNWLIILDNVKDSVITLRNIPKHDNKGYGHIVISTQNSTYYPNVMHLDKLSREESIELLLNITGEKDIYKADLLAETLKDYPLAVSRAGSFVASYPAIDIEEYNQLFLTKRQKLWEAENKLRAQCSEFSSYKNTVFTSLSVIINKVKKESELSFELLSIASFLDNENIPENILLQYIKNKYDKEPTDIEYNKALSILMKYSLLSPGYYFDKQLEERLDLNNKDNNKSIPKDSLLITHELIQMVTQDLLNQKEKEHCLIEAITTVNNLLPKNIYLLTDFLSQYSYLIPHIDSLLKNAEEIGLYNNEIMLLGLRSLEYHLTVMRHDQEAEKLINRLNEFSKKVPDLDNFIKMRFSIMKSSFLAWVKIDYTASLKEALLGLELMQEQELEEVSAEDKLMIYTLLARMYNFMDDNDATLHYANLGQKLIEKESGTSNLFGYKQEFFISLSKIAIDNGDYNEALKYYNLSLIGNDLNDHISPKEMLPSNLSIDLISVDIFISLGKLKKARQKLKILKKITDKLSSGNFYKVSVISYNNYLEALLGADISQAIQNSLETQTMFKKLFGETNYYRNRHVFMSYKFLGELYEMNDDLVKAKQSYSIALQILKDVYSQSTCASTDKLSDIYGKLAIINIKLQQFGEALEYFKLHQQVFGMEHPRSIKLVNYFVDKKINLGF